MMKKQNAIICLLMFITMLISGCAQSAPTPATQTETPSAEPKPTFLPFDAAKAMEGLTVTDVQFWNDTFDTEYQPDVFYATYTIENTSQYDCGVSLEASFLDENGETVGTFSSISDTLVAAGDVCYITAYSETAFDTETHTISASPVTTPVSALFYEVENLNNHPTVTVTNNDDKTHDVDFNIFFFLDGKVVGADNFIAMELAPGASYTEEIVDEYCTYDDIKVCSLEYK